MTSLETNNNVGNEENDGTSEEEEEDEDEPAFKFSPITVSSGLRRSTEDTRNLSPEFSCIALHEKFLVIGKVTGEILITDPHGFVTSHDQIKVVIRLRSTRSEFSLPPLPLLQHNYPINCLSIDDKGDFIGSCCQEGKVQCNSLLTATTVSLAGENLRSLQ